MQSPDDSQLHELARKRVGFRIHLFIYCVVNGTLWIIWLLTGGNYPWPLWPTAGWGIGVLFNYVFDYRIPTFVSEQEEYEKLKKAMEEQKSISR